VPWPLWIFSAPALYSAILIEVETRGQVPAKVLFAFLALAWLYFLLKGVRWVWIATVGIAVLGFVPDLILGSLRWQGVALSLIGLMLLLLPVTQRYFIGGSADAGENDLGN
jgi:hypothetical protein